MKKIILITLILFLFSTTYAATFKDTENHWSIKEITRFEKNRVIHGYDDGTFRPDENIKINEFIKLLVVASGRQLILEGEMWPDWYINTAKEYEIIKDFDDYEKLITRNEAARMVAKYIDVTNITAEKNIFSDLDSKYKNDILKLKKLKVINGYEDNTFRGNNHITRAEAVSIIGRAVDARLEIIYNRKIKLNSDAERYTNINKNPNYETWVPNRYETRNNKIYIYDSGRYRKLEGYQLKENNIKNKELIELLESLLVEDKYVYLGYVPDDILLSQIIVGIGEKESYIYNGAYNFFYTFYEDKLMNLKKDSQNDMFSDSCFMKITVGKMWNEDCEFEAKKYVSKEKEKLLNDSLKVIFEDDVAEELTQYIKEKTIERAEEKRKTFAEVKIIGKYTINCYMNRSNHINFYISK